MKRQLKKWILRLVAAGLFIAGLLLIIVLQPVLTYANKTTHQHYTIFHDKPLDPAFLPRLDQATALLSASEFYRPGFQADVCLNDGSGYPRLVALLRGQAFALGLL